MNTVKKEQPRLSTQINQKNQKQKVKIIVSVLSILLFVSNYQICEFFYPSNSDADVSAWWGLKSKIYAVIIALAFYSSFIGSKGLLRIVFSVGLGFAISNVIDKCYFNVLEFRYNDIIMIILTICFSLYDYLILQHAKPNKQRTT